MQVPDEGFIASEFNDDLTRLATNYSSQIAGSLKEYPASKWQAIKSQLSDLWFTIRWGI
jgi:hypothetical protein